MVLQSDDLLPTGSMPAPSQHSLTAFRDSATILPDWSPTRDRMPAR